MSKWPIIASGAKSMTMRVMIASSENGEAICRTHAMLPAHVVGGENIITARKAVYGLSKGAVSYTHLTLPTICSV
eukprot:8381-Prorocentrum_lima.AAC.1